MCEDYYPDGYWSAKKSGLDKWLENTGKDKRTIITLIKVPLCKIKKLLGGK